MTSDSQALWVGIGLGALFVIAALVVAVGATVLVSLNDWEDRWMREVNGCDAGDYGGP